MAKIWNERWRNVGELAPGGQAHTFLVIDVNDSSRQARVLKRLKNTSDARRERFQAEIEALKRLRHPKIVELIDHDLAGDEPYLVTEYCEGGSLEDVNLGDTPDEQLRRWFADVCEALAAAHAANLVHRDIKPANIFLRTPQGPAVLGDFGLVFDDERDRVTLKFEQVGSRFYMAPELRDGRVQGVHPASDLYSLGKVLYWMFSHGNMFDRENHRDAVNNVVTIRRDYYFEHLNRVLDKMILLESENRFETAQLVSTATTEAWRLMDGKYNTLTRSDQPCRYCGRGFYVRMPERSYNQIGIAGGTNDHNFRILCCTVCGNMQSFWVNEAEERDWITRANVPVR